MNETDWGSQLMQSCPDHSTGGISCGYRRQAVQGGTTVLPVKTQIDTCSNGFITEENKN